MSRGLVALLLVATLVVSGGSSALVSWAVTSAVAGAQDPTGADGGPAGADGSAGEDGADGVDGESGAPGPGGTRGPAGARGATGAAGPQGAAGVDGADGVEASVTVTPADTQVGYPGFGYLDLGDPIPVDAADAVLLAFVVTIDPQTSTSAFRCNLSDLATGETYATGTSGPSAAALTVSGAGVVTLPSDTAFGLACLDGYGVAQQWDVSALKLTALTFAD